MPRLIVPRPVSRFYRVTHQAIAASEQPGIPAKAGILAQADRVVRSKAHTWLKELLPELEEKAAVSLLHLIPLQEWRSITVIDLFL